jgi:hypothetical protein
MCLCKLLPSTSVEVYRCTSTLLHELKQSRNRPDGGEECSRSFRLPDFHDIRHIKVVGLLASRTGHLYPQDIFLVIIYTRDGVQSRAMKRLEGH